MDTSKYILIATILIMGISLAAYILDRIRFKRIERRRKGRATELQYMTIGYLGLIIIVMYVILKSAQEKGILG